MRKTIEVNKIIDFVNSRNKKSTCSKDTRIGWNELLEQIIMETDNYNGFRYLTFDDVEHGQLPGINYGRDKTTFPDDSRRQYHK